MIKISDKTIGPAQCMELIKTEGAGSVVTHTGVVKPVVEGRGTSGMRLVADGDPAAEMEKVEQNLREDHDLIDVVLARRLGDLTVGDVILFVGVSAKKKDQAMAACDKAVDLLKEKRGLKKEELFT